MASLFNIATILTQSLKPDGTINAGGKVYLYQVGTSTPLATYTDSTLSTQNPHPVILDSSGYANIWINADADIAVADSGGTVFRTALKINPTQAAGTSLLNSNNSWSGTNDFDNTVTINEAAITNSPPTVGQVQTSALNFAVTSGTVPDYTATLPLTPIDTTFVTGAFIKLQFHAAPTSGLVTINVNGIGALPLYYNGAQISGTGPIVINDIWDCYYDSSTPKWVLYDVTSIGNNIFTSITDLNEVRLSGAVKNSGWSSSHKVWQLSSDTALVRLSGTNEISLVTNAYHDGTFWRYAANGIAAKLTYLNKSISILTGVTGTSGNTVTFISRFSTSTNGIESLNAFSLYENATRAVSLNSKLIDTKTFTAGSGTDFSGTYQVSFKVYLECTTAEHGYSIGDKIEFVNDDGGSGRGVSIFSTSAGAVGVRVYLGPVIVNKGGTGMAVPSTGNWRWRIEGYDVA